MPRRNAAVAATSTIGAIELSAISRSSRRRRQCRCRGASTHRSEMERTATRSGSSRRVGAIIGGMASLLRDLYDHQHWADAEHWRVIEAHPSAAADQALRTRLHHINLVQRAFRWMVGDRQSPFAMTKTED